VSGGLADRAATKIGEAFEHVGAAAGKALAGLAARVGRSLLRSVSEMRANLAASNAGKHLAKATASGGWSHEADQSKAAASASRRAAAHGTREAHAKAGRAHERAAAAAQRAGNKALAKAHASAAERHHAHSKNVEAEAVQRGPRGGSYVMRGGRKVYVRGR
jgi:hypothetical protein